MKKEEDLSSIPCSSATNAYDLLEDVKAVIKADPKRYNQEIWVSSINPSVLSATNRDGYSVVDTIEDDDLASYQEADRMPECGTVACVAGWVWTMKAPQRNAEDPHRFAAKILKLSQPQAAELFAGDAAGRYYGESPENHAARGIAHITRFQAKYKDRLLKTPV